MTEPSTNPRVYLVGHCTPDSGMLRTIVERSVSGAAVSRVNTEEELAKALDDADLLLVNRALDGTFPDATGVDLIARLAPGCDAAFMLVSNFEEAQRSAEQAGAVRGFGKDDVYAESTAQRIADAIAGRSSRA